MQKNASKFNILSIFKILLYPFIGLYFVFSLFFNSIYSLIKYCIIGIIYLLYLNVLIIKNILNIFLKVCKYIGLILLLPFKKSKKKSNNDKSISNEKLINESKTDEPVKEVNLSNNELISDDVLSKKEKIHLEKIERKKQKQEEKKRRKEEKKLKKIEKKKEKKEKKKKLNKNESYINENVKIEKPTLNQKLKTGFSKIGLYFSSITNKLKNNTFSKNRRNKKEMKRQVLLIDFEGEDAKKSDTKLLYEYVAKDKNGKIVKDYFMAYSKIEVHSFLLSEGYEVYSIKTNKLIQLLHQNQNVNKTKFKNKDLIFFLTQLSTYIKAGIPLVEALRIISRQYKKKQYQKIFRSVIYELTIGENLSDAMEKQNVAFPKLLINMVKTAEMTGSLPEVLDDMSQYYTEAEATRKQMITAMTYPSLVFTFAVGVMIFIMVYVVPKFVVIYDTMEGTELPGITKAILGMSTFMKSYWYLLIIIVILLIVGFIMAYKKLKSFRTGCQWIAMHIPIIKNTIIYNEVTMFTKTFSSLLAHNVPITDCMDILNKITNNEIYKMLILDTIANLARGGKISDAFKDNWAFPIPAYEMIVTGEATGELSEMMNKVSFYYQDLHKNSVTRIKTFIEPALTIFLTVGVGIIILSIIVPMFDMYSAVQDMG